MNRTISAQAACLLALCIAVPSLEARQDLKDMSLEALLNIQVSVASKKTERLSEAPGIVSVITAEQIGRTGYRRLTDILQMVPGVLVTQSYFGLNMVTVRGVQENNYNNRTLFMINGTPVRDITSGTYFPDAAVPVDVIERIEIIRGPGSVLYGTGAFAGVVNVITRSDADIAEASVRGGSENTRAGGAVIGRAGEAGSWTVAGSMYDSDGYKVKGMDEMGRTRQIGYYEGGGTDGFERDFSNAFGSVSRGGATLDVFHFVEEYDKMGVIPVHVTTGEQRVSGDGAAFRYERSLGGVDWSSRVHYFQSNYASYIVMFPPPMVDPMFPTGGPAMEIRNSGRKWGADLEGSLPLSPRLSLLAGVSYEYQQSDPASWVVADPAVPAPLSEAYKRTFSSFLSTYDTDDTSIYTQLEYSPLDPLKLVGGVRYNHNRDYGSTTVPRVSAVWSATDRLFLKALYGSAYRNPTFFEKYINTKNLVYGDPSLDPEKISTFEAAADWIFEKRAVRLTYFDISTEDMIGRTRQYNKDEVPDVTTCEDRGVDTRPTRPTPGYENSGGQRIRGGELELRGELLGRTLSYSAGVSYKEGEEKATGDDIQFLDKLTATLTGSHRAGRFTNTATVRYIGKREGDIAKSPFNALTGLPAGTKVTVEPQTFVDLKSSYGLTDRLTLSLIVMNLFEEKTLHPEYIRRVIPVIPGVADRRIYGEVSYRF